MYNQKGLAPLLIIILIALVVGGILIYQKQLKPASSPLVQSSPSPTPTSAETANWKTFKMVSSEGFGYEIKLPPNWDTTPFAWGEGIQPLPKELAENFFDKNCGVNKGKITVLHFLSNSPQRDIERSVAGLKKDGFTSQKVQTRTGINIEKLTGNLIGETNYYAYFPSVKGYYYISGRDECVANYGQIFDQILSTFKFLDQNTITNTLPYKGDGFSFVYPANLKYIKVDGQKSLWYLNTLSESSARMFLQSQLVRYEDLNIGNSFSYPKNKVGADYEKIDIIKIYKKETVNLGNKTGKRFVVGCGGDCTFYVLHFENKGRFYELILSKYGYTSETEDQFNSIISTFKFTD